MRYISLLLLVLFCGLSWADELKVEYASFYSHLKKIDNDETQGLQFAFGFKNIASDSLCHIRTAQIVTPKVTLPVSVSDEQRFILPTELALKQAHGVIHINLEEQANQCDLSVQLETKPAYLKRTYQQNELLSLLGQYESFFDDVGGFMSFLMPDVIGLQMHFAEPLPASLEADLNVAGNKLILDKKWIQKMQPLTLPSTPFRITAITD
ncbi:DUF2987 domain-containing protein [Aliiglaciecola litoralis]|uniref:DUF2987 domain-containing protein n=1 Tax=Aliiglaciecola litoralis TaxID=582857 RepID=A0ABP3WRN1_9ALTE